jgi:hypothetical protein
VRFLLTRESSLVGLGSAEHVLAFDDLDAFAAFGLAEGAFVGVEAVPAVPGGEGNLLAFEERGDRVEIGVGGAGEAGCVLEEVGDGFVGVALGVTDQADGSTLDPAGDVGGRDRGGLGRGLHDAACFVGDGAGLVVEGELGDVLGEVADGAVDRLDVPVVVGAGAADVAGAVEFGAFGA